MPAAHRKSKPGRLLGRLLAMAWAAGLLLGAWRWIGPTPVTDGFRESPAKWATDPEDPTAAPTAVEMAPTSLAIPGGGLPFKPADPPPAAGIATRTNQPDVSPGRAPERLPDGVAGRPLPDSAAAPSALAGPPAANRPLRLPSQRDSSASSRSIRANSSGEVPVELHGDERRGPAAWGRLDLREVMPLLHAADPALAAAAEEEVQRRGIVGPLIELARLAGDADPHVRQSLVESLPTLSGIDARPWLLELSYDDDPRVRGAAITLMATSGDVELLKRVKQVALEDPDDHTREQAEKALPDKPVERR